MYFRILLCVHLLFYIRCCVKRSNWYFHLSITDFYGKIPNIFRMLFVLATTENSFIRAFDPVLTDVTLRSFYLQASALNETGAKRVANYASKVMSSRTRYAVLCSWIRISQLKWLLRFKYFSSITVEKQNNSYYKTYKTQKLFFLY